MVNMDKIPEELKPFVKDNMTKDDYKLLGTYLMQKKIDSIKARFRRLFSHEKR